MNKKSFMEQSSQIKYKKFFGIMNKKRFNRFAFLFVLAGVSFAERRKKLAIGFLQTIPYGDLS